MTQLVGYTREFKVDGKKTRVTPVYNERYRVCYVCENELKLDPGETLYIEEDSWDDFEI